jgi:hypothetical protein
LVELVYSGEDVVKKPSLRWSKESHLSGVARVCEGPRGWILKYGGVEVAHLSHWTPAGFSRENRGWYWSSPLNEELGIRHVNTYSHTGPDWEYSELDQAKAHVRECIRKMIKEKGA